MRKSVYAYDPDDEQGSAGVPKWRHPKTELAERALKACGRKFFKDRTEIKRWRKHELSIVGSRPDQVLHKAWVVHNIFLCEKANRREIERSFPILLSMIENSAREVDWKAANREGVLKERAGAIEDLLFGD